MLWIVLSILAVAISYVFLTRPHKYWIRKGVKQGKPTVLFGETWGSIIRKQSMADLVQMSYDISPNSR